MAPFTVSRHAFDLILEAMGDRRKAELMAQAIEMAFNAYLEQAGWIKRSPGGKYDEKTMSKPEIEARV